MISIDDFDRGGHRWIMASEADKRLYGRVSYKYGECVYEVELGSALICRTQSLNIAISEFNSAQ